MNLPILPDMPAGYVVQAADLNNAAGCVTFLMNKPYVRVTSVSAGTSIGTGNTAMHWDTRGDDPDNMASLGSFPTRLTVQTPGWFKVRYGLTTTSNSLVNMTFVQETTGNNNPGGPGNTFGPFWGSDSTGASGGSKAPGAGGLWPYYMYAGDYLEVYALASATGDALDATGTSVPSFFSMEYISMESA